MYIKTKRKFAEENRCGNERNVGEMISSSRWFPVSLIEGNFQLRWEGGGGGGGEGGRGREGGGGRTV